MTDVVYVDATSFYAGALEDLATRHGVTLTVIGRRGSDVKIEVNGRHVASFVTALLRGY